MKKYLFLVKRFLKQPGFYIMLLVLAILSLSLKNFSKEGGQLASIGIVLESNADEIATAFFEDLYQVAGGEWIAGEQNQVATTQNQVATEQNQVARQEQIATREQIQKNHFSFYKFMNFEHAQKNLLAGEIDEIWLIPKNLTESLEEFVLGKKITSPIEVTVLENDVSHLFLREVLFSKLMKYTATILCSEFIHQNLNENISEAEIYKTFKNNFPSSELFVKGNLTNQNVKNNSVPIILLPLRGMLAIWLLVCSFALSFLYIDDEKKGLFTWWTPNANVFEQIFHAFFYHFFIMMIMGTIVFFLLIFNGLFTSFRTEIISLFLYLLAAITFVNFLRILCGSAKKLGICMTLIILLSLVFTPVLFTFPNEFCFSYFFPGFFYLKGINNLKYLKYQILYILIVFILEYIVLLYRNIRQNKLISI